MRHSWNILHTTIAMRVVLGVQERLLLFCASSSGLSSQCLRQRKKGARASTSRENDMGIFGTNCTSLKVPWRFASLATILLLFSGCRNWHQWHPRHDQCSTVSLGDRTLSPFTQHQVLGLVHVHRAELEPATHPMNLVPLAVLPDLGLHSIVIPRWFAPSLPLASSSCSFDRRSMHLVLLPAEECLGWLPAHARNCGKLSLRWCHCAYSL